MGDTAAAATLLPTATSCARDLVDARYAEPLDVSTSSPVSRLVATRTLPSTAI